MTARDAVSGFAALSHPVRLALFRTLCDQAPERASAGELAQGFDIPPSTMTGHLQTLERAGLIKAERRSRFMLYSLNAEGTRRLARFLLEDCCHLRPELVGTDEEAEAQADALMRAS
ncbi:MAG: metalloregulator ArsR/SmtB family transcription factor [Alphaproteobacteria bacterium]|jgi:ArsR family transcriptional regulator, arsenate/arsenite/antimonite-responsive transcriptional repressor|uniref:ArsR/SmtB family transcription factor n=1 Tax=Maricaulis alexandrii TaxID=2570354 RepID=UPI00110893E7|nr:metalloregulator ArsR/SmtB family transcription factor [Maricaulis alexandrii]MCR9266691.1 metalloregulator ArsR/SmtB family transcription factor [Alphaproteobacteria bacterium]